MITVLVAATTALARAGLAGLLDACKSIRVLVAPPGVPWIEPTTDALPDVLLIDLGAGPAAETLRDVGRLPRPPAVVVIGDDPDGTLADEALRAGARAVLPRHATAEEIAAAVDAAAAGLVALHPDALRTLRSARVAHRSGAPGGGAAQPLTPREIEVLGMMAEGLGNKIIAARLGISEHTVKFHVAAIFAKLDAGSRTEAVTIGLRQGLILI